MLSYSRNAVLLTVFSCCLLLSEGRADSSASEVVKFLPDDAIPQDILRDFIDARHIGGYRVVQIDTDALRAIIRDAHESASSSAKPVISFPLVDGSTVSIELIAAEEHYDGWQSGIGTFIGRVVGDEYSSVQCVLGPDGSVHLTIRTSGERHAIRKTSLLPYHVYWTLGQGFNKKID